MHINPKLYTKCPLGERDKITTWIIKIWRQINLLWKLGNEISRHDQRFLFKGFMGNCRSHKE